MKRIKFRWAVFFALIVSLAAYAIYLGLVVGEIVLPGGFRFTFREDSATLPERKIENLSKEELEKRQAEFKKRFKELEQKVKQPQVSLPFQRVDFNLSGTWYGQAGLTYQIVQNGAVVAIQELNPYYGIAAIGSGQIQGQTLVIEYQTVYETQGFANLTLSPDGSTLDGFFRDTYSGYTTTTTLNR